MASNTNLGTARLAMAAISHTLGNRKVFSPYGALQAARSPQNAGLIAEMNPRNAKNAGRLSIIPGQTTPQARVTLNYRPQEQGTVDTSRTVGTGSNPSQGVSLNVDYNTHREQKLTYRTVDLLAIEKEAENYLKQSQNGSISVKMGSFPLLSDMGDQIMRKADDALVKVNTVVMNNLISGVGGNLLLGTSSNTGVPTIQAFNADGSVNPYVWDYINDLKQIHAFEGKPIIVGGTIPARYFNRRKIVSAASLGYDYEKMFAELDVEFYYDPLVDTLSGPGHMIIMDAGSFCLETIMEHAPIDEGGVIPFEKVGNTTFGQAVFTVAQTNAPTFTLDADIRVREDDSVPYPQFTIIPSFHFGTFAKPAGFHKNYDGWDTVTKIFRVKLQ